MYPSFLHLAYGCGGWNRTSVVEQITRHPVKNKNALPCYRRTFRFNLH
jgi:hypothetical protein